MGYDANFKERGHAWFTYHGLTRKYRGIDDSQLSNIKIHGSTVSVLDDSLLSDLERIANKCRARYKIKERA